MGDWCGEYTDTTTVEIEGVAKERVITIAKRVAQRQSVKPCKGKNGFSLNGEYYSLTRGLLMGDPFSHGKSSNPTVRATRIRRLDDSRAIFSRLNRKSASAVNPSTATACAFGGEGKTMD